MTRIFLAQNNPIIGNFDVNISKIVNSIKKAKEHNCSMVVTSELAISGYPPKDLLFYPSFFEKSQKALESLLPHTKGITLIVGCLRQNTQKGNPLFNSLSIIQNEKIVATCDKQLLPNYDVFNEKRYFEPGNSSKIFEHEGKKIALTICEDIWYDEMQNLYPKNPLDEISFFKPDLLVNLSASPFELHKLYKRMRLCQRVATKVNCPVLFCNQVGGHDSLIFDGFSFAVDQKHLLEIAEGFKESYLIFDTEKTSSKPLIPSLDPENLYHALVLGIRDYFSKQGFKKAILGLSGGIDSALVAVLAAHALGPENVTAVSMPSRYSSTHSLEDAQKLAKNLRIEHQTIPIESIHASYLKLLETPFQNLKEDVTEENLQSRIRGMILMALSNKFGSLVLSCGNKSEMAMGYSTLYGDLAGGVSVISDISKSQVYDMAKWINLKQEEIPLSILEKPPSAELKPNQKDSDTLPDYSIIDAVIEGYVQNHLDAPQIAGRYRLELSLVEGLIDKINRSEYKRQQAPFGFKVTQKAFSSGRNFPIVHHHHG